MRCDVEWLRLTDGSAWTHQCTDSRHYRVAEMSVYVGQQMRQRPSDFREMLMKLQVTGKLTKHYRCRAAVVERWRKELYEEDQKNWLSRGVSLYESLPVLPEEVVSTLLEGVESEALS